MWLHHGLSLANAVSSAVSKVTAGNGALGRLWVALYALSPCLRISLAKALRVARSLKASISFRTA